MKFKIPPPKQIEIHAQFARTRAEAVAVLADVYLHEKKQVQGADLIAEAFKLDPLVDDVNTERGRLALLNHDDALALESFERAQLLGSMKAPDREKMMELYRLAHGGSDATFTADMDARYAQLYPPAFTPGKPAAVAAGHTVLLELFTGSGCPPCIGGDIAVEGVLDAYPRGEVVALAFDQHIPEPDPLTNPDSVARAEVYDIAHTPEYVIDGKVQPIYGARREGSEDLYGKIAKAVDATAPIATGVQLKLSAANDGGGLIHARAVVTVPSEKELETVLAVKAEPEAVTSGEKKPAAPAAVSVEPHLVVNFALVEDDVRYSGENGIRFHRMVVRALAKPAGTGFSADPAATVSLDASFDPAAISRSLVTYLEGYEQNNDRFGKITFLTKDMTMQPEHLAVAAWVQDSVTHRVLQAAVIPVGAAQEGAQ